MDLDLIPQKQLNELEVQIRSLLVLLRKAKLQNEPVTELLQQLELTLSENRHQRFDSANSEYRGY
jgi:antitoxin component of MazEF toxin-antitoxin module